MTIESFATITRHIISRDGFDGFLPTFCYPSRRHISVLEGYPEEIVPESVVLESAAKHAEGDEEFLAAFKIDAGGFRVIHRAGECSESRDFPVTDD